MRVSSEPFRQIAVGTKVIESRLYDEKRQQLALGDEIVLHDHDHPENSVTTRVIGLLRYPSFAALFADHHPSLFGATSTAFLLQQIRHYYSVEDEVHYGVVGIRLTATNAVAAP